MTRDEAIRTIGDVFARAGFNGDDNANPINLVLALSALGVTDEEMKAVAERASAEYREAATADRCDPVNGVHSNPHKGCFLR